MGGTRFNGLALVDELVQCGHEVTVLNRGVTNAELPASVKRLTADRHDESALKEATAGQEYDCIQDISAYLPSEVETMVDLFRDRTGHYIFVSSTVTYAASDIMPITEDSPVDLSLRQTQYGRDKIMADRYLMHKFESTSFPATVVPLSMVMGPNNPGHDRESRMFDRLLTGRPIFVPGDGTTLGQVGYVADQASALEELMNRAETFGRRYNLTGRDYYSAEGYVDTMAAVIGVTPNKVFVPGEIMDGLWDGLLRLSGGELRWSDDGARSQVDLYDAADRGANPTLHDAAHLVQRVAPNLHRWNSNVIFSIDRLRQDVGWSPRLSFAEIANETYKWYAQLTTDQRPKHDYAFEDALGRFLAGSASRSRSGGPGSPISGLVE